MRSKRDGPHPLAPALLLLDPDDRPGGRSSDDLVRDRAYARMWLATAATTALAILAVGITQLLRVRSVVVDIALVALAMLPACTLLVMVMSSWSRHAFARRSKDWTFIYSASAGGCAAAVMLALLWEALDPIGS